MSDYDPWLFAGVETDGHLSNELSLWRDCPPEFLGVDNPWTEYMYNLFQFGGILFNDWQWKRFYRDERAQKAERAKRVACWIWIYISANSTLHKQERIAVLAWMLSEMLDEVPRYETV